MFVGRMKWLLAPIVLLSLCALAGCAGSLGNVEAVDPTERGLSYIACAIVTHAVVSVLAR